MTATVIHGDARHLPLDDNSVDAIVTDPPYELGFMGKQWDNTGVAYDPATWSEALRVLKPGGHLLAFGGTRTWHRLTCAIEDAGFEIRDSITWLYGTGFPKSLDVSKAIDKAAGATREVVGTGKGRTGPAAQPHGSSFSDDGYQWPGAFDVTAPATEQARQWAGWGTALKPASEPIVVARKPFPGTVAANILAHGAGAINIDACRVGTGGQLKWAAPRDMGYHGGSDAGRVDALANTAGRWPPNVVLSHAGDDADLCADGCVDGCSVAALDAQSGISTTPSSVTRGGKGAEAYGMARQDDVPCFGDTGGASRFFPVFRYQAKAPARERPRVDGLSHPTVKPLTLMRWLCRLVTPPGGTVLDPFAGSGTTLEAAGLEGFRSIGVECEAAHLPLIEQRLTRLG